MSCLNPYAGILTKPIAKQFASLSERQLDERHSKKTKDVTNCHKLFWLRCKTVSRSVVKSPLT